MKFPSYLVPGDRVAIVSPAGFINQKIVERGAVILREQGFVVEIGHHAFGKEGVFSGSDMDRSTDMQKALDDKSVKAIFFSRGGYGSIRTHANLNWSSFFKKPKWLIGFSDITVFHSFLSNHKIASVHGVMTAWFEQKDELTDSFIELLALLRGAKPEYKLASHPLNRVGENSGTLIGGNLSIIQSLRGTALDLSPKGKILFIEDIDEHHYHIDRMMLNLKTGGILKNLSGLIVGYFTAITDGEAPFEKSSEEIIREAVADYGYPVAFGFPAGHELPNKPLLLGGKVELKVSSDQVVVKML
ncbi:MAG: LD-carboxypeptidase [Bacteroidia bacterium]|nr:LD-carboxypeptidase [Bacteroidia bacterium]